MARKTEKSGKFRNVHCRTWNMTRKVKIMENEGSLSLNKQTKDSMHKIIKSQTRAVSIAQEYHIIKNRI